MSRAQPFLALVVPCYNEQETLPRTLDALRALLDDCKAKKLISPESFALYVDDGSKDGTWSLLEACNAQNVHCKAVKFAGNAGHQNAVLAGMQHARSLGVDCIISLDADLQDDISVIPEMLALYGQGNEIVYGVRNDRTTDSPFKRGTAHLFYAFMGLLQVKLVPDHADFRLVGRFALDALQNYHESNVFLRGIFPAMGFRAAQVYYRRLSRVAGESKYPVWKMLSLAWKGITSFSAAPLRLAGLLSMAGMGIALVLAFVALYDYIGGAVVSGWTSLIIVVLFMGSVQLFCLGVMGEYIAKMFVEIKARPRYIVERILP
ncbi:MAG: glycosyltransferase family 2 protein [Desulfovibrionaceae bacterium]